MSGLPDYESALAGALRCAAPLPRFETVALADALDRVLAKPLVADRDLPPFDRAQMDGYALRAAELGTIDAWPVVRTIAAGVSADGPVPPGSCVAIATGAPVPDDVDTVIQHEKSDRNDPVRFTISSIAPGHAVHPRGADARAGDALVDPGVRLAAHHLGIAATVGRASVDVVARPRAIILSSGDELRDVEATDLAAHQIRDSNGPQLRALLGRMGAEVIATRRVPDDRAATIDAVATALADADLVVTVGGVSAGDRDHFPAAFDAAGIVRELHGAAIQPGKPVLVGRAPSGAVVTALPGNPVSCLACACLFTWPVVRTLSCLSASLPWTAVILRDPVRPNPRRQAFRPAVRHGENGVSVPRWAGSGDLAHTASTHGLVALPVQDEEVPVGTRLRFLPWPGGER